MRRVEATVDGDEKRSGSIEEAGIASELLKAAGFVFAGNVEEAIHLLAEFKPGGSVGLPKVCRIHVVFGWFSIGLGAEEVEKIGHP